MHKIVKTCNLSGNLNQMVIRMNHLVIWIEHLCSTTAMFTVNSLHVWWNLDAAFTLCQSTLSNLWHSNSFYFCKAGVSNSNCSAGQMVTYKVTGGPHYDALRNNVGTSTW